MQVSLKAARVNAGLRQTDVAQEIGCSVDHVKWLEGKGASTIRHDVLLKMCKLYGCSIDDIFLPIDFTESEAEDEQEDEA